MKNLIKKALAVFLTATVIFGLSACRKSPQMLSSNEAEHQLNSTKDYITLLYSSADSFNPYTAQTDINRQLCKLLYEPLIKLNNQFEPIYCLAESITSDGKKYTVTLKNVFFSDGSQVTASDVVYSCKLAMASSTSFGASLYEVAGVTAQDDKTVVFTLNKNDAYFANLLDFPILKAGSEKITDSDSVLQPPIGCGRYMVSKDKTQLVQNNSYYSNQGNIKTIRLINAPDSDSVAHYIEIGATDLYYSEISDGRIIRMSGNKLSLPLNNLVYLGINRNNSILANTTVRQAISTALDREKLCREAYYNNAISANGFFNPMWSEINSVQNIEKTANQQITIENLEKIGYNKLDGNGIRTNGSSSLKFTLLVNSENRIKVAAAQLISNQLKELGILATVVEKNYAQYVECLKSGSFQLYLGETKITGNMDLSPLICAGGAAAFGLPSVLPQAIIPPINSSDITVEEVVQTVDASQIINGYYEGSYTITDIAQVLQDQMPIIPICYRTGVLFYNDKIENVDKALSSDIYFSIDSYIYNS